VAPTDAFRLYETCRNELGHPQKGAIAVGSDADIIVFDPAASKTISAGAHKYMIDYNVFEGVTITGLPRYTLSRGTVLWGPNGGQPRPGHGRHLMRSPNPPVSRGY
jgi:dihydropyrimidinase